MKAIRAGEYLEENFSTLSAESAYKLTLAASGDADEAEKAFAKRHFATTRPR